MMLFKRHYMPPTCYVQEAAYWVAFGRCPEFIPYEDHGDARDNPEAIMGMEGDPEHYDWGYTKLEMDIAEVDVDFDRYSAAKDGLSESNLLESMERLKNTTIRDTYQWTDEQVRKVQEGINQRLRECADEIVEARYAEEIDALMVPIVDRARAAVFQELASGKIKAKGWVDLVSYDLESNDIIYGRPIDELGEFRLIQPSDWSLRGFDWQKSTLSARGNVYTLVQIDTDEMMDAFPEPFTGHVAMQAKIFAGCGLISDEDAHVRTDFSPRRPSRGRPPKLGGVVREAIQNYFRDRVLKGGASDKREAIVQEAMDFAKLVFNETISRPTAQNYLAALAPKRQVPQNMPEIHAGK